MTASMRVWPGRPSRSAPRGTASASTSPSSPSTPPPSTCACSTRPTRAGRSHRIPLTERTEQVWHGYLPDVRPGQLYGYRVHGPHDPGKGHRFNPQKLLFDPYAKAIGRSVRWHDQHVRLHARRLDVDLSRDDRDNAAYAPLASVSIPPSRGATTAAPTRRGTRRSSTKLHVRGFTKRHPGVPEELRGTLSRLVSEAGRSTTSKARRHRRRAHAGPPSRRRVASREARAHQLLGLQHPRLLRPRPRYSAVAIAERSGARVQDRWSARCTPPASR